MDSLRLYHPPNPSSAPPTPSMTEGKTQSDLSTTLTSSTMSSLLHERLRERKRELQREGRLSKDSPEKSSEEEDNAAVVHKNSTSKLSATMAGRRVASMASSRKSAGEMGFREQEQYVSRLDKQNFDLKLKVYHQDLKIQDMRQELKQHVEDRTDLMKLVDDQQKELDKREGSLKEAVDTILLLQDKVRHLEKQLKQRNSGKPSAERMTKARDAPDVARPDDDRPQTSCDPHVPNASDPGRPCSARGSSLQGSQNGVQAARASKNGSRKGELGIPFIDQLDAIDQDRHGLRARTTSALSRYTDDSRYAVDRMMVRSPSMSVLSEGDFESVYNWKDKSVVGRLGRRYSADLSDIWHHTSRPTSRASAYVEEDTLLPGARSDDENGPVTYGTLESTASLAGDLAVAEARPPLTPKTELPELEVSNVFSRRTANSQGPSAYGTPTKSRSELSHADSEAQQSSVGDSPYKSRNSELRYTPSSSRSGARSQRNGASHRLNNTTRPHISLDLSHSTIGGGLNTKSPHQSATQPSTPSGHARTHEHGYHERAGHGSQPTTPQLRSHAMQHPSPRRRPPTSSRRPQSLSAKDQQILEYIAQQRVSDWIHPSPHQRPTFVGAMFERSHHPLPPTPPETRTASRQPSSMLDADGGNRSAAELPLADPSSPGHVRPSLVYTNESLPSHHAPRGLLDFPPALPGPRTSSLQRDGARDTSTRDRTAAVDSAPGSTPTAGRALAAETLPAVEQAIPGAWHDGTKDVALERHEASNSMGPATGDGTPTKSHPPVSLSQAARRGLAGLMRRRGSSSQANAALEPAEAETRSGAAGVTGLDGAADMETSETAVEVVAAAGEAPEPAARRRGSFSGMRIGRVGRRMF